MATIQSSQEGDLILRLCRMFAGVATNAVDINLRRIVTQRCFYPLHALLSTWAMLGMLQAPIA